MRETPGLPANWEWDLGPTKKLDRCLTEEAAFGPRAAVLVSSWLDVTPSGDTETTLHDADLNALYEGQAKAAAGAFADLKEQTPYASPVYGDFLTRVSTHVDSERLEGNPSQ